jgi:hypothetical protein
MRILANGAVLIGNTTDYGAKLQVKSTGNGLSYSHTFFSYDNSTYGNALLISHLDGFTRLMSTYVGTGIDCAIQFWTTTSAGAQSEKMRISANGNIGAPNGSNIYNASDIRLKQNITKIENGLDKIIALNPVKFNWLNGFEPTEDGKDMLGFIAQEVQNAIPEAVENFGNNSVTIGETIIENPLRVNDKFIIPVLVKAIQEMNTKIIELEKLVATK